MGRNMTGPPRADPVELQCICTALQTTTTTDTNEQNDTGPLGGPVIKVANVTASYNDVVGIDIILCTTENNSCTVIYKTPTDHMTRPRPLTSLQVITAKRHTVYCIVALITDHYWISSQTNNSFNNHILFAYKLLFGLTALQSGDFFILSEPTCTREHPSKLFLPHCSTDVYEYFFCHHIGKIWN